MKKILLAPFRFLYRFDRTRKALLSIFIRIHYLSYLLIKKFVILPGKEHPKHELIAYADFFLKNLSLKDHVLDVGCSQGGMTVKLAGKAKKVTGIDIIKKDTEKAIQNHKQSNLSFILGDATMYPFEEKFDVITLSNVLEHIDGRINFLKKISPLAPKLLIRVPLVTREWLPYYLRENGYEYRLDPTHYTEYTEEEIQEELRKAGFSVESFYVKWGEWYGVCTRNSVED